MKNKSLIALAFSLLILISCKPHGENATNNNRTSADSSKAQLSEIGINQLPNNQVCMVNNKFMNKEQIAVQVNGKTYYGCCNGCEATLKNDSTSRIAADPLTGEKVDKASAFIFLKPGSKDAVLYFSSVSNAIKYSALSK